MGDKLGAKTSLFKRQQWWRQKSKRHQKVSWKENKNIKIIKTLETTQIENKINHLEKSKFNVDSLKEDQKEFIRNNQLILKKGKI